MFDEVMLSIGSSEVKQHCALDCTAGSSPGAQQRVITCTSSSSSEMAQLDDVCLSPGYFIMMHLSITSAVTESVCLAEANVLRYLSL